MNKRNGRNLKNHISESDGSFLKRVTAVSVCLLFVSLLAFCIGSRTQPLKRETAGKAQRGEEGYVVVLDAGHGGDDPGKIGAGGSREKDINLQIVKRLQVYLEANDIQVVLTRDGDSGLCEDDTDHKKVRDMKKRIEIIEQAHPTLAVSIHQNSYPDGAVHGAQVFYYKDSFKGQRLAECLQEELVSTLDPANHRKCKDNNTYYLLKNTGVPMVIAECGFLSNAKEEQLLGTEEYRDRTAWAVAMGILKYLADFS